MTEISKVTLKEVLNFYNIKTDECYEYTHRLYSPDGIYFDSIFEYIQIEILKMCGCGDPEENVKYIYNVLKTLNEYSTVDSSLKGEMNTTNFFNTLKNICGNDNSLDFMLYWLDVEEYTEHGSSIYGSWLTDKGKMLLRFMEFGLEEFNG